VIATLVRQALGCYAIPFVDARKQRLPTGLALALQVEPVGERARQHIDDGAVTEGYSADRETVLQLLNDSLATELVCVLRYRHDYFMARGLESKIAADEFLEHAKALAR